MTSLEFLEDQLQTLIRAVNQMPPAPDPAPNWSATSVNLLFDLRTLVDVIGAHPHLDDAHRDAALDARLDVWERLTGADLAYHRAIAALPPVDAGRGGYLVTHLCPGHALLEAPCGTFATLEDALLATGHLDPAQWAPAGDDGRELTLALEHRRNWLPVSPWRIRMLPGADRRAVTENPCTLTGTAAHARH